MTAAEALDWLAAQGSEVERAALARYGIPTGRAFGVPMGRLLAWAKRRPKDAGLAAALWADGRHEARMLAILIDDPAALTPERMDAMVADLSDWAICDTAAFRLFDRSPHAWGRLAPWCADERLYVRRAGLALIWALALHDKGSPPARFLAALPLVEAAAADPRPHVAKAVTMATRALARRDALREATRAMAERLLADPATARAGRAALKAAG